MHEPGAFDTPHKGRASKNCMIFWSRTMVCVCACAVSCFDGSCRSNRLLAEALKATDTLDLLSHTLIVPQGWINPYPRELAMAMRYVA